MNTFLALELLIASRLRVILRAVFPSIFLSEVRLRVMTETTRHDFGFGHGCVHGLKFIRRAGRRNSCFPLRRCRRNESLRNAVAEVCPTFLEAVLRAASTRFPSHTARARRTSRRAPPLHARVRGRNQKGASGRSPFRARGRRASGGFPSGFHLSLWLRLPANRTGCKWRDRASPPARRGAEVIADMGGS